MPIAENESNRPLFASVFMMSWILSNFFTHATGCAKVSLIKLKL